MQITAQNIRKKCIYYEFLVSREFLDMLSLMVIAWLKAYEIFVLYKLNSNSKVYG